MEENYVLLCALRQVMILLWASVPLHRLCMFQTGLPGVKTDLSALWHITLSVPQFPYQ